MSDGNEICYAAERCIRKCREALVPEDQLGASGGMSSLEDLMAWFQGECGREPHMALIADMLRAEGRAALAVALLPDLERYLANLGFELRERLRPPVASRPVLVVDNAKPGSAPAQPRQKVKGKQAAGRPAGDAA